MKGGTMKQEAAAIAAETRDMSADDLLAHVVGRFGEQVALASSMGAEDQVITAMLCGIREGARIFTIDTGRLPQETHDTIAATNGKYGVRIKVLFPDREPVEEMVSGQGPNLFRDSVEARKQCCHVRKVVPLRRELASLRAWITGLRKEQSVTRRDVERVEWDESNGLVKVNPLADWTHEQVWQYIRGHDVPVNPLHDQGYPSIGCAPCTRAVADGQDLRSGRWWWEQPRQKECGLHVVDGRPVRAGR